MRCTNYHMTSRQAKMMLDAYKAGLGADFTFEILEHADDELECLILRIEPEQVSISREFGNNRTFLFFANPKDVILEEKSLVIHTFSYSISFPLEQEGSE